MIISVSGPHGTGKSTYAARLAKALRIRHVSAGSLFRRIAKEKRISLEDLGKKALEDSSIDKLVDERTIAEADKGNVVVDGQLAGWILNLQTEQRESFQRERYARHYGFQVEDRSIYHLVLDTSLGSIRDTATVLVSAAIMVRRAKKAHQKSTKP